ncbi:RDD family protein [Prauserella cavernicola]|nr:RDD family protein [Prauserella cavernicola]
MAADEPKRVWLTPVPEEARAWQGRSAGLVSRTVASVLDLGLVLAVLGVGYLVVCGAVLVTDPVRFHFPSAPRHAVVGLAIGVAILYFAVCWRISGRTYGDRVLGLRVTRRDGRSLGWARALLRAAFCTLFPVGLVWVAVSPARHSIQDLVLRTTVTYDWSTHTRMARE